MLADKGMSKPIPRIGAPPPEKLPVVVHRRPDKELAAMSNAQLREHLRVVSDEVERAMNYQEMVCDMLVIRRDVEAKRPLKGPADTSDMPSWY